MNSAWDIEEIVLVDGEFLQKEPPPRRQRNVVSSAVQMAVVAGVLSVAGSASIFWIPSASTSGTLGIIDSSARPNVRSAVPPRTTEGEAEFVAARTPEQLAKTFEALFRPSASDDIDSDYVFL